jgi:hypothetical protein
MKMVAIGGVTFSKAICGTNAFYGRSHFSTARDAEYQARFSDDYIIEAIETCLRWGINTVETSANERIDGILDDLRLQYQGSLHCIGSTRIDETSAMKSHNQKLEYLIEHHAAICVIHAQFAENAGRDGAIPGLERMLEKVRAAGLLTAVSAHRISTVELCERKGYPIDTYLFPLNSTGFVYPGYEGSESAADRVDLVRGLSKPLILMKVLGAGRIPPEEGLQFAAENSKPNDLISLGFGSLTEIEETMKVFEKLF